MLKQAEAAVAGNNVRASRMSTPVPGSVVLTFEPSTLLGIGENKGTHTGCRPPGSSRRERAVVSTYRLRNLERVIVRRSAEPERVAPLGDVGSCAAHLAVEAPRLRPDMWRGRELSRSDISERVRRTQRCRCRTVSDGGGQRSYERPRRYEKRRSWMVPEAGESAVPATSCWGTDLESVFDALPGLAGGHAHVEDIDDLVPPGQAGLYLVGLT